MALIAVRGEGALEREIGVCRYITLPDAVSCEFAIAVADAWQGRGLGWAMMTRLAQVARSRGLKTMTGTVLGANASMLALCEALGFVIHADADDAQLRVARLDLEAAAISGTPSPATASA
jgi:acetyltransferase